MAIKELFHGPLPQDDFDYDAEEALSFCDLPIHSDAADWIDSYKRREDWSSSSSSDIDFFEFSSSGELHEAEDVVFCGKVINRRESIPSRRHHHERISNKISEGLVKKIIPGTGSGEPMAKKKSPRSGPRERIGDKCRPMSGSGEPIGKRNRPRSGPGEEFQKNQAKSSPISRSISSRLRSDFEGNCFSPLIIRSAAKPRHRLPLFGPVRVSQEMEISEIRRRQGRRQTPSRIISRKGGVDDEDDNKVVAVVARQRRGIGLWGFVRALGCWNPSFAVNLTIGYVSSD